MAVPRDGEEDFGCFETLIALVRSAEPGQKPDYDWVDSAWNMKHLCEHCDFPLLLPLLSLLLHLYYFVYSSITPRPAYNELAQSANSSLPCVMMYNRAEQGCIIDYWN